MLTKFASFGILDAVQAAPNASRRALKRIAHRVEFEYEPRPGYLYIRSRAISSRCNDNFDEFPAEEIKQSYGSFIGKPVFVNHNNDNHRRARGIVIDAKLHEDTSPDGRPDTWAEVLMEVDAVRFPKLAKAILSGHIDRTSMGTDVAFSKCSYCGNKATTPLEYCSHIPGLKGKRVFRTATSGQKEGVLIREICYGLKFFENSLLVEEPADPTAYFLGVDARGLQAVASKYASSWVGHPCQECGGPKEDKLDGGWTPICRGCWEQEAYKHGVSMGGDENYNSRTNDLSWASPGIREHLQRGIDDGRALAANPTGPSKYSSVNTMSQIVNHNAKLAGLSPLSDCKKCRSKKGTHCEEGCDGVRLYKNAHTMNEVDDPDEMVRHLIFEHDVNAVKDPEDVPGRHDMSYLRDRHNLEHEKTRQQQEDQHERHYDHALNMWENTPHNESGFRRDSTRREAISDVEFASLTSLPPLDMNKKNKAHCKKCGAPLANALENSVGICPACEDDGGRRQRNRQKQVQRNDGKTERVAQMLYTGLLRKQADMWGPSSNFERLKQKWNNYSGRKDEVPLGMPNTYLRRDEDGNYHVKYHATNVVSYSPDGRHVTYRHNGWTSPTTATRMNAFGHENHSITFSQRGYGGGQGGPRVYTGISRGDWGEPIHFDGDPHVTIDTQTHAKSGEHVPDDKDLVSPPNRQGRGGWYRRTSGPGPGDNPPTGSDMTDDGRPRPRRSPGFRGDYGDEYRTPPNGHRPQRPVRPPQEWEGADMHGDNARMDMTPENRSGLSDDVYHGVHPDDMPREDESMEDWVRRTTPDKPKFDNCRNCRGKGFSRNNPERTKQQCSNCAGHGYVDKEGKPYDPGEQQTRSPSSGPVDMRSDENPSRHGWEDPVIDAAMPRHPAEDHPLHEHLRDDHNFGLDQQRHVVERMSPLSLDDAHDTMHQDANAPYGSGSSHVHTEDGYVDHLTPRHRGVERGESVPGRVGEPQSAGGPSRPSASSGYEREGYGSLGQHINMSHGDHLEHHDPEMQGALHDLSHSLQGDARNEDNYPHEHHPTRGNAIRGIDRQTGQPTSQYVTSGGEVVPSHVSPEESDEATRRAIAEPPISSYDRDDPTSSRRNFRPEGSMKHHGYGEMVAPRDVDTLRDEECPVCAEKDSYDGDQCQVCGFVKPPAMFMDPNLELAQQVDLRKENDPQAMGPNNDPLNPGGQQANPMDPNAVDAQGMPNEVPGSGMPGTDAVPLDPANLDANGNPVMQPGQLPQPGQQPMVPGQQVMPGQQRQLPLNSLPPTALPGMNSPTQKVGPDGQPLIDPNTGLPLTGVPGGVPAGQQPRVPSQPGMPGQQQTDIYGQPLGPLGPIKPGDQQVPVDQATGLPVDPVTGQPTSMEPLPPEMLDQAQQASPGQIPGAGVAPTGQPYNPEAEGENTPQLMCPLCGFTTMAAPPMSSTEPMGMPTGDVADGAQEGDMCPQCGRALLMADDGEMEGMGKEMAGFPEDEEEAEQESENPFADDQDEDGIPDEEDPAPNSRDNPENTDTDQNNGKNKDKKPVKGG